MFRLLFAHFAARILSLCHAVAAWCERHGRGRHIPDRDDPATTYLSRYYLIGNQSWAWLPVLALHRIRRSDSGDLHDHPWSFFSLVVHGKYIEVRPVRGVACNRWRYAGSLAFRRASDLHLVLIADDGFCLAEDVVTQQETWTLVLFFRRKRDWGFAGFDRHGIRHWQRSDVYLAQRSTQPGSFIAVDPQAAP